MTNKKLTKLICTAAISSATFLFGGCGPDLANLPPTDVAPAIVEETANAPANATEEVVLATSKASAAKVSPASARNTPVVQVAKNVGPAVVGITNKAVARDFFNRQIEMEGVGSGVIFQSD